MYRNIYDGLGKTDVIRVKESEVRIISPRMSYKRAVAEAVLLNSVSKGRNRGDPRVWHR